MTLGFIEARYFLALGRERGTVGNGVGVGEPVGELPITLVRIKPVGNALARLPGARAGKPLRHQLDADKGERADQRHQQDDERPGLQAPGA
jgi:hypothetical protein